MKKTLLSLGLVLLAGVSLISCSKGDYNSGDGQTGYNTFSDKNNQGNTTSGGNFTAQINGSGFTADNDKSYAYGSSGIWAITGSKGSGTAPQSISISLSTVATGTYSIGPGKDATGLYLAAGSSAPVVGQSGSLVITESTDSKVKGTFEIHASGLDITSGTFDVPIKK